MPRINIVGFAFIIIIFVLALSSGVFAQDDIPPANANDAAVATFLLTPEGESLHLTIEPASNVAAIIFEPGAQAQRRNGWTIIGTLHDFDGVTVTRKDGAPLQKVEFSLSSETEFYNRRYFAIDRIGSSGWLFYKPVFALKDGSVTVRITGFEAALIRDGARDVTGQSEFSITADDNTLLYIGPRDYLRSENPDFMSGPEVPDWLRVQMTADMSRATTVLTARLGGTGKYTPTLYVSQSMDTRFESPGWKGGALDGGVIALRLRRMELNPNDTGLVDGFTGLVTHETVHMWIGHRIKNAQNAEQSWAHEGTSEYISSRLRLNAEAFRKVAEDTLNRCMTELGPFALDGSLGPVQGRAAYDCGFVISLFAELGAAREGRDILDIWSAVMSSGNEEYQPQDFLDASTAYNPQGFPVLAARLLTAAEDARWDNIAPALDGLPIKIEIQATPADDDLSLNNWWLGRLMQANCDGAISIYNNDDHKDVAGQGLCTGRWDANFDLVGVNGRNMFETPRAVYDDVRNRCGAGLPLTFDLRDGTQLTDMPCGADIPAVPPFIRIIDLPLGPLRMTQP